MHVISRRRLREFGDDHPDAVEPLDRWYRIAKRATWGNFSEVHSHQVLLIRGVYTHKDYDDLNL